jgi:hypothetical protein
VTNPSPACRQAWLQREGLHLLYFLQINSGITGSPSLQERGPGGELSSPFKNTLIVRHIHLLLTLLLISCTPTTQPPTDIEYLPLERLATLPKSLTETSGIATCGDSAFYVHNDSGNKPRLYQISASTGSIEREIRIRDVKNHDWEELAEDSMYVYIGDFGNNEGIRSNLMIYKVNKNKLASKDEADAEIISFEYPEKTFFESLGKHNYDCEAMIALKDSLYIFSKNRGDLETDVYRLPKQPGEYTAERIGHFNTRGLITAADFLPGETNTLALLGYEIIGSKYKSFLWIFRDFSGTDFFGGTKTRYDVAPNLQAEAVLFDSDSTVIITNEEERGGVGNLSRLTFSK